MLPAIHRNNITILKDIFDTTTPAPISCDLEPDIHIGHEYISHEPTGEQNGYQGLQEIGS